MREKCLWTIALILAGACAAWAQETTTARSRPAIVVMADVFNLFNQQTALDYDSDTQTTFPVLNPDFGQPSRFNLAQLQTPRQIRIGVR